MRKLLLFFAILSFPYSVLAQDTLAHRFGFLMDYDGNTIDNLGVKYRISSSFALTGRFMINLTRQTSDNTQSEPDEKSQTFEATLGAELLLLKIDDASLLALTNLGYSGGKRDNVFGSEHLDYFTYSLGIGIGAEYSITDQFSISGHQNLRVEYSESKYSRGSILSHPITRRFIVPHGYFVLTFYF